MPTRSKPLVLACLGALVLFLAGSGDRPPTEAGEAATAAALSSTNSSPAPTTTAPTPPTSERTADSVDDRAPVPSGPKSPPICRADDLHVDSTLDGVIEGRPGEVVVVAFTITNATRFACVLEPTYSLTILDAGGIEGLTMNMYGSCVKRGCEIREPGAVQSISFDWHPRSATKGGPPAPAGAYHAELSLLLAPSGVDGTDDRRSREGERVLAMEPVLTVDVIVAREK